VIAMFDRISEPDWKIFKPVREQALERFCESVLAQVERIQADATKSHHRRYIEVHRLMEERDKELIQIFDHSRRSTAITQLAAFRSLNLVTDEEFSLFTQPTRDLIEEILQSR
jgi:hypothetical protein